MSQKSVHVFIARLLTDEDLRGHFLNAPEATLDAFRTQGYELTDGEVDALLQTDRDVWAAAAARILPARLSRRSPTEYGPAGFASTSTAPSRSASSAAWQDACPRELMTMTGMGRCRISWRRNVSPSMRGISMSSVRTSGFSASSLSRAM
jgi:hypothetical protein